MCICTFRLILVTNRQCMVMKHFKYSLHILPYERSVVFSKAFSTRSMIQRVLFQITMSSVFLNSIQWLLTSSSSSSCPSYLSFSNLFQEAVPKQDATNPVTLPPFYCIWGIPLLLFSIQHFFVRHTIGPNDLLHPSPVSHFRIFQVFLIYFPKCPSFSTTQSYAPNVALHWFIP